MREELANHYTRTKLIQTKYSASKKGMKPNLPTFYTIVSYPDLFTVKIIVSLFSLA